MRGLAARLLVGTPLLRAPANDPEPTITHRARRTNGSGAESLADGVDGLLGQQPMVLVVDAIAE